MANRVDELIVRAVYSRPILYDGRPQTRRNKIKSALAWIEVADELEMKEKICKRRWSSLRAQLARRLRLEQQRTEIKPRSSVMRAMEFMDPIIASKRINQNVRGTSTRDGDNVEPTNGEDEDDLFLRSLKPELKRLGQQDKFYCKVGMLSILKKQAQAIIDEPRPHPWMHIGGEEPRDNYIDLHDPANDY